jgi:hypothetical protein
MQSFIFQVNIVLSINDIHKLVNVIIVDLFCFIFQFCKMILKMVTWVKEGFYHNLYLTYAFFSLSWKFLIAYINNQTIFSIDVLTWCD